MGVMLPVREIVEANGEAEGSRVRVKEAEVVLAKEGLAEALVRAVGVG